ncbi:hypothetical protein GYMLUDRAFT_249545 [Collybiopsis luxurians FD-317 M1]|uniref:Uncharacterized protein n=1 Tax=Collybiopsis luxurians FD-317 M1 TaxID=944289 RepID=A0A0D0C8X3_9AGAR|nr:hypothetical protein GYMLUDRAFT_249545 [Collybiopsis luxurians FD-317 M1]
MSEGMNGLTHPQKLHESNTLLSKLRNFSSISSLFFSSNAANATSEDYRFGFDDEDLTGVELWDPASELLASSVQNHRNPDDHVCNNQNLLPLLDVDTPTPTRPATPRNNLFTQPRSYSTMKYSPRVQQNVHIHHGFRDCNGIKDADEGGTALSDMSGPVEQCNLTSSSYSTIIAFLSSQLSSSDLSSLSSNSDDTPPLSPNDDSSIGSDPSIVSLTQELQIAESQRELVHLHSEEDEVKTCREEIKEGKRPAREISFDALIDDLSVPNDHSSNHQSKDRFPLDNAEEWYGLEYTLELSRRERRASETYSCDESVGESSRSRESWAALRLGRIHPFFEVEDYHQWKNWHLYLDREDERRKHCRGREFEAKSKDLALLYLKEMRARDLMHWQQEVYGMVGRDVKERLAWLAVHRRDPYYPPKKHNFGWYLKRSRSIACLRELQPKGAPIMISRGGRARPRG